MFKVGQVAGQMPSWYTHKWSSTNESYGNFANTTDHAGSVVSSETNRSHSLVVLLMFIALFRTYFEVR